MRRTPARGFSASTWGAAGAGAATTGAGGNAAGRATGAGFALTAGRGAGFAAFGGLTFTAASKPAIVPNEFAPSRSTAMIGIARSLIAVPTMLIPCPAVTYHRRALDGFRFRADLRVSLDWAAWLELAARPGAFVWLREVLMEHRIHAHSETTAGLDDGTRRQEDLEVLSSIWPRPIARLIVASYQPAYAAGH